MQHGGKDHLAVRSKRRQRVQRIGEDVDGVRHPVPRARGRRRIGERVAQRRRQRLQGGPLQQRGDVVDGGNHGRAEGQPSVAGMTTLPASRPQEQP